MFSQNNLIIVLSTGLFSYKKTSRIVTIEKGALKSTESRRTTTLHTRNSGVGYIQQLLMEHLLPFLLGSSEYQYQMPNF